MVMTKLVKEMHEAINKYGIGSKEALIASERLDKEVSKRQREIYERHKNDIRNI